MGEIEDSIDGIVIPGDTLLSLNSLKAIDIINFNEHEVAAFSIDIHLLEVVIPA